ncbi:AAA family ATPase [Bacillus sp. SH8-8]
MTKYRINKLYIKNFKLVKEATVKFESTDIVVLDGPNGFGKTTIFDTLELVITGNISRIKDDDGRRTYKDILFCKDGDSSGEILIKVELINEQNNRVTIVKRLPVEKNVPITQRKPTNFSIFDTHILEDFEEAISQENKKNQNDIEAFFGTDDLSRLYNLYYYIQQEESTRYLKDSEKRRRDEINHLFNTKKEKQELEYIKKVIKILNKEIKNLNKQLNLLRAEENNIKLPVEITNVLEHKPIIEGKCLGEWDKKDLVVQSEDQRNNYIKELMELREFINGYDDFKHAKHNKGIDSIIMNKNLLKDTIIIGSQLSNFEEISTLYQQQQRVYKVKSQLEEKSSWGSIEKRDLIDLEKILKIEIEIPSIEIILDKIEYLKKRMNGVSQIVMDLNEIRQRLLEKFNQYINYTDDRDKECPMCGHEWTDSEELIKNIENKKQKYSHMYNEDAKEIEGYSKKLSVDYFEPVIKEINNYLMNVTPQIKQDFYEQLNISMKNRDMVVKFLEWCGKKELDIDSIVNQRLSFVKEEEILVKVDALSEEIEKLKEKVDWKIDEYELIYNKFYMIYNNIFKGEAELISKIDNKDIEYKIKYLNWCYEQNLYKKQGEIGNLIRKETEKLEYIQLKFEKAKKIRDIYSSCINEYELKIINDIEILFYIYSGRLLQYYQRGMGLFIQNTTGGLKFVANSETDHDAINYLSSGQLSALVIAFTLTLNKIYSNNKLGLLLIDDPVQTMDDINMASLVELLRNEFRERQIILSTHEDNISRYIRYKFSKYGLKHKKLNVKEVL